MGDNITYLRSIVLIIYIILFIVFEDYIVDDNYKNLNNFKFYFAKIKNYSYNKSIEKIVKTIYY